jgi:hypothetical protein
MKVHYTKGQTGTVIVPTALREMAGLPAAEIE